MLDKISGTHGYSYDAKLQRPMLPTWSSQIQFQGIQELSVQGISEISGNQLSELPEELSELPSYDCEEPSHHVDMQAHGSSAPIVHKDNSTDFYKSQHGPSCINTFTDQRYWTRQMRQDDNSPQVTCPLAWTLPPQEYTTSEGYHGYSYEPPVGTAAAVSHSGPSAEAVTAASTTFASISPASYHNACSEDVQCGHWDDAEVDHHATFPNALPTCLASPPYGHGKHIFGDDQHVSPIPTPHDRHAGNQAGASMFPPTPPTASPSNLSMSISPTEHLGCNFKDSPSSPSTKVFRQQGLVALPASATYDNNEFDTINPMQDFVRRSHWERRIPQDQRQYRTDTLALHTHNDDMSPTEGFDETMPSHEEISALSRVIDDNATCSVDAASASATSTRPHCSVVGDLVKRFFSPLLCGHGHCKVEFNGEYRKGNRERHIRRFHRTMVPYNCRFCPKFYQRDDARKKHEWKKHGAEDCRPEKRRPEKRHGETGRVEKRKVIERKVEKRIYMPNSAELE